MKLRHILLVITLVCFTVSLTAQTRRRSTTAPGTTAPKLEDLPKRPLDTIPTSDPETKIILFSNNTWSYYRPSLERLDSLPVYTQHWDTTGVFAYRDIAYNDLPPVVELKLVDDLTQFKSPVTGKVLSKYGPRRRRNHNGVDIPLRPGEPVYATFDGRVRYAKYNTGGYGNLVIVRHRNGLETWNAHLSKLNVKPNDYVKAGQVIGFSGNTGRSRGPHLHYEMRYQDQTFDPEFIVDFETGQLKYQTFALEKSFFNIHSRASEILEEEDEYDPAPADLQRQRRQHLAGYPRPNRRSPAEREKKRPYSKKTGRHQFQRSNLSHHQVRGHARKTGYPLRRNDRPDMPAERHYTQYRTPIGKEIANQIAALFPIRQKQEANLSRGSPLYLFRPFY